ncbi:hypothetical protein JST97_08440 [bacterium]|nr:hypothetical protein [bacterium]
MRAGLTIDEACHLVPEQHWAATSRNWWFQALLENVLKAYPGFEDLAYLLSPIVAVPPESVASRAQKLRDLLQLIKARPEPFARLDFTESDPEMVRQQVGEAEVLRCLDDDCRYAHGNFFSYLLSQAEALEEAKTKGWALLSLHPQPDDAPETLTWPA